MLLLSSIILLQLLLKDLFLGVFSTVFSSAVIEKHPFPSFHDHMLQKHGLNSTYLCDYFHIKSLSGSVMVNQSSRHIFISWLQSPSLSFWAQGGKVSINLFSAYLYLCVDINLISFNIGQQTRFVFPFFTFKKWFLKSSFLLAINISVVFHFLTKFYF